VFQRRLHSLVAICALFSFTGAVVGAENSYDFKDPKGVNHATFLLDSPLEPIMGVANGISGKVSFDPAKPKKISGKISVAASSIQTLNKGMTKKLQTGEWIASEEHAEISFELSKVKSVKKRKDGSLLLRVEGKFTLKGVEKVLAVDLRVHHHPGKLKERNHRGEGDLLVLRSDFTIKRGDFGVGGSMPLVADEIEIRIRIVGASSK